MLELKLDKAWANSLTLTGVFIKDGSTTTKHMERVEKCLQMEKLTRGNGNTILCTVKEFLLGQMVSSIKDNTYMTRDTD